MEVRRKQLAFSLNLSKRSDKFESFGFSHAHIPWVTVKFLLTDAVSGKRKMTRARWNNVLAPLLLPLVSEPLGPMTYCLITAKKR
jgi:hypothetical protein